MNRVAAIRVAAAQVRSRPGEGEANRERATRYVEQAAGQAAQLIVLPELFSCGYVPNRAVWTVAEAADGPTARWLGDTARRLGVYLGAGTAQSDGLDIFNVFLLAGPDGRIVGRAVKANAEASVFRRGCGEHIIDTDLGRIGIGICADNQFASHRELMHRAGVDLILMPHAWPTPARAAGLVSRADVQSQQQRMIELPALYARTLGVAVVFVNQVGPLEPIGGILGRLMDPAVWRLRGQSRIINSDGAVVGVLSDEEGLRTATVTVDPDHKHYDPVPVHGRWLQPGSAIARRVFIPIDIATGRLSYAMSQQRRRQARRAVSGLVSTPR
jgi:N-carbamoylputrescine amidase